MSIDFTHARSHAEYRIRNSPLQAWPHRHAHIDNVFPANFYAEMLRHLPDQSAYTPIAGTGRTNPGDYDMRSAFPIDDKHCERVPAASADFWRETSRTVLGPDLGRSLLSHFGPQVSDRLTREAMPWPEHVETEMTLVRDRGSEGVKVHSSDRRNLLTLLFYLPPDERWVGHGTTIYAPKDTSFRCWGGPHHETSLFNKVWTAPFRPNSLFLFIKSDDSFHGVEPVRDDDIRRDLILFYVRR